MKKSIPIKKWRGYDLMVVILLCVIVFGVLFRLIFDRPATYPSKDVAIRFRYVDAHAGDETYFTEGDEVRLTDGDVVLGKISAPATGENKEGAYVLYGEICAKGAMTDGSFFLNGNLNMADGTRLSVYTPKIEGEIEILSVSEIGDR